MRTDRKPTLMSRALAPLLILIITLFNAGLAHAAPGCSTTSTTDGSSATNCQWRYTNPAPAASGSTVSGISGVYANCTETGNDSGCVYASGASTAPAPQSGTSACASGVCSDGVRQDHQI